MSPKATEDSPPSIGYLTVVQSERTGWTGGLLVLDHVGRPLEFQCTLPVRPTRTHEILFGPTLRSHLIAEVIAGALMKKCRTRFSMLCCDQIESLDAESLADCPFALVAQAAEEDEGPISNDMLDGFESIEFAGTSFFVAAERFEEARSLAAQCKDLPDPVEPFERIREAIKEAHSQLARQHGDAA
ncbi:MAG: hypothetical protein AAFV88_06135 [Planctomycetota bacterium]